MEFDISGLSVFIAVPVNRDFPWQTAKSLFETGQMLTASGIRNQLQFLTGGSQIDHDRSELARQFMASGFNRLFWIDSDMSWAPQDFRRLLALSTVMPIVGASYPVKRGIGNEFLIDIESIVMEPNEYGCFEIRGMGLGFTVMQREVIERMSEGARSFVNQAGEKVPMIFRTGIDEDDNCYRSEDMHFFKACRKLGYKINLDPTIELGHVGGNEWKGRMMDALRRKGAA